jgi:uncharacterized protein DUF6404
MTHREKVDYLLSDPRTKGVNQYTIAPPVFRLLWAVGVEIPPPFFMHSLPLALFMGLPWAAGMMTVFMWLYGPRNVLLPCVIGGVLFGLSMAAYYRLKAKRMKLSAWKSYGISN